MVNSIQFPTVGLPGVILDLIVTVFLDSPSPSLWIGKAEEHMAVAMSNDFSYILAGSLSSLSLLVAAFKHNLIIYLHFLFCTIIPIVFH